MTTLSKASRGLIKGCFFLLLHSARTSVAMAIIQYVQLVNYDCIVRVVGVSKVE